MRVVARTDRVYDKIRESIWGTALQPGRRLQDNALAELLGTRRTPVREALRRLQAEGLIDRYSARGAVVAQVSIDDVENAYLVLEVLEALASRLAAERMSDAGATKPRHLPSQLRDAASAGALQQWTTADGPCHGPNRSVADNPTAAQGPSLT